MVDDKVSSSLFPRLWPKIPIEELIDALEEMVLVRLGVRGFEKTEQVDEVDAVEPCRSGLGDEFPRSVCARLNDGFDITYSAEQTGMRQVVNEARSPAQPDAYLLPQEQQHEETGRMEMETVWWIAFLWHERNAESRGNNGLALEIAIFLQNCQQNKKCERSSTAGRPSPEIRRECDVWPGWVAASQPNRC